MKAPMVTYGLLLLAGLAVVGCPSGATSGKPVKFRVSVTFDTVGSYNLPVDGTSTLDGTFTLDYLRQQPVEVSAKDDATWQTASDQTWHVYEANKNCGLGGDCIPCDSKFVAPSHDVAVGTRIDSRSGDTVVAYTWIYNTPPPYDLRYHSGCNAEQEFGTPWGGWGPILITFTVNASDVTALTVTTDPPGSIDSCDCTLTIERLP